MSSLGKLCEFQRGAIPGPENVVPQWLSCLPLREDKVEARAVHEQLARMLEKGDPHLLGPNREHLGRVVKVFAVAMPTATLSEKLQLCTKETAAKMKAILMQMQGSVPPEQLQAAWGVLSQEEQVELQRAIVMETAEVERDRGGPNHESVRAVRALRESVGSARARSFFCVMDTTL